MKYYSMNRIITACLLIFLIGLGSLHKAQAQETSTKNWHYLAEIYMFFPYMNGNLQMGDLPSVELDASPSDLLDILEMGAMVYVEATNDDWSISSDFVYMKLGVDAEPSDVITSGELETKQYVWELAGMKRITPWLDAGLGGRFWKADMDLDLNTIINSRTSSKSYNWFDPVVIVRSNHMFNEHWFTQLRADAGGFGIGSDFTWQLQANVGYRFSDLIQSSLGYRFLGVDYDNGETDDKFVYDIDYSGFVVRVGFNF